MSWVYNVKFSDEEKPRRFTAEKQLTTREIQERCDRTNHYNEHQGEFRYGMLDIDVLRRRVVWDARGIDFVLDVTHCDEMDRLGEFKRYFDHVNAIDTALV